jgi:hypothetical protein
LSAVLNVEAAAGWSEVFAAASSKVSAQASSNGGGNATSVGGYIQNWTSASVGQPSRSGSGNPGNWGGTTVWQAATSNGTATGTIWLSGDKICASTRVKLRHNSQAVKVVTKCQRVRPRRAASNQPTLFKWLTGSSDSQSKANKS